MLRSIAPLAFLYLGSVTPGTAETCPNCKVPVGTSIPCKPTEAIVSSGVLPGSGVHCHVTADVRLTRTSNVLIKKGSLLVGTVAEVRTTGFPFRKRTVVTFDFHELIEDDADGCIQNIEGYVAALQSGVRGAVAHQGTVISKRGPLQLLLPLRAPMVRLRPETTLWVKTRTDAVLQSCKVIPVDSAEPDKSCVAKPTESGGH